MKKKFIKKKEDFICENCQNQVHGNGFTNHCPKCLISKHLDCYPGDRSSNCGGLMDLINWEFRKQEIVLEFKCQKCLIVKKNKMSKNDNFDKIIYKLYERI